MFAELSVNVQLVMTGEELVLKIPPPLVPEFPVNVQLVMVGEELVLYIPPPPVPFAKLFANVQFAMAG